MLHLFHSSLQISRAFSYYFLCLVIRNHSICAFWKIHCVHLQNQKSHYNAADHLDKEMAQSIGDSSEVTEKNLEEVKVSH